MARNTAYREQRPGYMSVVAQNPTTPPLIGGCAPPFLRATDEPSDRNLPRFLHATVLPGRGMNLLTIRAFVPGLGEIDVLRSPSLHEAAEQLNGGPDDFMGVHSFRFGGAILLPFKNRIRGRLMPGTHEIETRILDREVRLPAEWQGKNSGRAIEMRVSARNVRTSLLPVGIGWHPYFALPSGHASRPAYMCPRESGRLSITTTTFFQPGKLRLWSASRMTSRTRMESRLDSNISTTASWTSRRQRIAIPSWRSLIRRRDMACDLPRSRPTRRS